MDGVLALAGGIGGKKEIIKGGDGNTHPIPWAYSHGVKVGNVLFIAGQVALDEELRIVGMGDAAAQARQVWKNIQNVCEAAGGKVTDVVSITTWVDDLAHMEAAREVRREFFPNGDYPVASARPRASSIQRRRSRP